MKKILILGGDKKSEAVIKAARKRGYYIILCDYNDKLESIKLVDKFYCVSVFDEEKIFEIAKNEHIDGIVSYSSDKIALVACKIANKLHITKNPVESIETLIRKDKFRQFLIDNSFNTPKCLIIDESTKNVNERLKKMTFPLIVKPVDSAGSTGVTRINSINEFETAYENAKSNSQSNKVIVEEFIEMDHECMIAGDAFVHNGKVIFFGLLNSHRGLKEHPFIPTGTSYPFQLKNKETEVKHMVQSIIAKLRIDNCPLNLELMYGKNGKLYTIEIAPRNGGNQIPNLIKDTYGVDMFDLLVATAVKDEIKITHNNEYQYATTYVIRSDKDGILKSINYDDTIKKHIYGEVYFKNKGDEVFSFDRANKAIGIIFLSFDNLNEEFDFIHNIDQHIDINLE